MRFRRPVLTLIGLASFLLFANGCSTARPDRRPSSYGTVAKHIESHRKDFHQCFGESPLPDATSEVRLMLKFWITPEGSVDRPVITQSSVKFPILDACILSVLQDIRFDQGKREIEVLYPLSVSR